MKKVSIILLLLIFSTKTYTQDCIKIKKKVDEYEDITTFDYTGLRSISLTATVRNGLLTYYLSLNTTGSTLLIGEKGVFIILDDGQKIIKTSEEIDCEFEPEHYYGSGDYEYSAFIRLNSQELDLLKNHSVKKFKLYIFEQELNQANQDEQKELIKCLIQLTSNAKK